MSEIWKAVPGYEGMYEVSDQGNVRSLDRVVPAKRWGADHQAFVPGRMLRAPKCQGPYRRVNLSKDNKQRFANVAHLVAAAFLGPRPEGLEVCHINGVSDDDRSVNLRYGTPQSNSKDRTIHGTQARGETSGTAKLTNAAVAQIRAESAETQVRLAERFGVSQTSISRVLLGRTWAHVA